MMNVFEKIREKLEELCEQTYYNSVNGNRYEGILNNAYHNTIEIVNKVEQEHNNGWIPCSEQLPEEHDSMFAKLKGTDKWSDAMFEKISDDVNATVEFEDGTRKTLTLHTNDGKWNTNNRIVKFNVIAWQLLPEPYKESDTNGKN